VIVAQQRHHVFRIGGLGEAREAAQVTEERSDFPAVALKLFLHAGRHDQIGHLRGQETSKPTHAFDLAYLVCNTPFKLLIKL
jgi:hypothetical protein